MYRHHISKVSSFGADEREWQLAKMLHGCPATVWPDGMPCSLDPRLVFIGVSPGNSSESGTSSVRYVAEPAASVDATSNFYYPDSKRYWEKIRYLASAFVSRYDSTITEKDALLITSHFNLGTGSAGTATAAAVDEGYIRWVSDLLNRVLRPDLVVLFGLGSILADEKVSEWWSSQGGLKINWKNPHRLIPCRFAKRAYQYREWLVSNSLGHKLRMVMWPNHPSRSPFSNMVLWKQSVDDYVASFDSYA